MEYKGNQNTKGLNLDSINWQVEGSQLTWALNANIMSQDGNTFTYTNEMSNQVCVDFSSFKNGYRIIGLLNIVEQNKVVVFLVGPDGKSEIGVITDNGLDCVELESVETDCGCAGGKVISDTVVKASTTTTSSSASCFYGIIEQTIDDGLGNPVSNYPFYYTDCSGNRVNGNTSSLIFKTVQEWYADLGYTTFTGGISPTYLSKVVSLVCFDPNATNDWLSELSINSTVTYLQHPQPDLYDTFVCESITVEKTCCSYEPVLIDECCQDCCQDCYTVTLQTVNPTVPSGGSTGQVVIEYTDCNGNVVGIEDPLNTFEGTASFNMIKDSWRIIQKGKPGVEVEVVLEDLYSTGDCNPCLNPAPENCCLNFDMENPVYATYRVDQCETRVYFVDRKNPPRYLSLEFPLNRDACGAAQDCGGKKLVTKKTCKELNIFPDTCHPKLTPVRVSNGGQLKAGVYQFAIAYTDEEGAELTDYFDFTQPIPIFEKKLTNLTDYQTNYSITVQVDHKVNIFDYFNLVVAETIQGGTTNYHLIGNYRVQKQFLSDSIVYTGEIKSTFSSISPLVRTPYYKTAGIVENQNDILMLADLEKEYQYNFQPFANKLKLQWETVKMPHGDKWDYSNPEVVHMFRTYQRDEVYAFGIKFKLKTGKYTEVFHIPGRAKNVVAGDDSAIPTTSTDYFVEEGDCSDVPAPKERWRVYNTAGAGAVFTPADPSELEKQFSCAITSDKRGEFAYWESTETYPCNEEIWDTDAWGNSLSGQPIRFHKFPDSLVSHIHDGLYSSGSVYPSFEKETNIYPIGVRIDADVFNNLLNTLAIANPGDPDNPFYAKDIICGFELVYATRVGHKSVVAKGLLYDVGQYQTEDGSKEYYYPNYPFNDINWRNGGTVTDPYLRTSSDWYKKQDRRNKNEDTAEFHHYGFVDGSILNYKHNRFTFHSPDTHFSYPKIGSELKLETLEIGTVLGHFVQVEEHSSIKLFTDKVQTVSNLLSILLNIKDYRIMTENYFQDKEMFAQLIERFVPKINFGWQYNGVAKYNGYLTIANNGQKRRSLKFGNYAPSEILNFGQGEKPFHNRYRESSVYLSLNNSFDHLYPEVIDNSRYAAQDHNMPLPTDVDKSRTTRAYYGSVKVNRPNQYGPLTNLRYLSTGYSVDISINPNNQLAQIQETYYPAFGGDTFINAFALKRKHAFFRQNLAGKPDDIPFNYYLFPNLGYPSYFYGFNAAAQDVEAVLEGQIDYFIGLFVVVAATAAVAAAFGDGVSAGEVAFSALSTIIKLGILDTASELLASSKPYIFLDRDETFSNTWLSIGVGGTYFYYKGMIYLFSYGLPIFFVESDVNVDFRHGRNDKEENFYSAKELGEIPDQWLQEVNVPIKYDNFYHYNQTYSVQNVINPNFPYNEDWPELYCETDLYNRVIYSDAAGRYGKGDPWLNFRRGNYYDFPKTQGKLIALNGIENGKVYARFENGTKLYNAIITLDSNNPIAMEIGDASMFKQKPLDLSTADIGYLGSQHKAFIKTTHGGFWVDARRGHVYQITSGGIDEISLRGSMQWFKENLPFKILKDFPNFPIDNTFKGIGITLGWDERFHRVFLTKLDYKLQKQYESQVTYVDKKFYYNDTEIEFADLTYFENHSFTVAYNVLVKSWISFYSFTPNHYVSFIDHFQTVTQTGTWNHNLSPLTYQTYYNRFYPYIIEYTSNTMPNSSTVNSVTYFQDIQKYYNRNDYYSLGSYNDKNTPNFTKAIIYNKEQTSGIVNLIAQVSNDARQRLLYPRVSRQGLEILVSKRDHKNSFNGFWDVTNNKENFQNLFSTKWDDVKLDYPIDKVINPKSVVYTTHSMGKQKIRAVFCKVRLIQDKFNRYKFINHLQLTQTNNSIS